MGLESTRESTDQVAAHMVGDVHTYEEHNRSSGRKLPMKEKTITIASGGKEHAYVQGDLGKHNPTKGKKL